MAELIRPPGRRIARRHLRRLFIPALHEQGSVQWALLAVFLAIRRSGLHHRYTDLLVISLATRPPQPRQGQVLPWQLGLPAAPWTYWPLPDLPACRSWARPPVRSRRARRSARTDHLYGMAPTVWPVKTQRGWIQKRLHGYP